MLRFFVCINLVLVHVFCATTEDNLRFTTEQSPQVNTGIATSQSWNQGTTDQPTQFNTGIQTSQSWNQDTTQQPTQFNTGVQTSQSWNQGTTDQPTQFNTGVQTSQSWNQDTTQQPTQFNTGVQTSQSWDQGTTQQPLELSTNIDVSQMSTKTPLEASTESMITQIWQDFTTEKTFEQQNITETIEQMTSTISTTSNTTCPSVITDEMLEEIKREIMEGVLRNISSELNSRLEELEELYGSLNCSKNNSTKTAIELSWQIYENLQIPLTGWLLVFDQPYSHKTRIDDLNQLAGICHNEVLVGATYNGSISLAAVGPASVLTINTVWNQAEQFGQVYWYRSSGKSFGFSPSITIRQTTGDNQDLDSPLRLSWLLDQNMGGYRAGATRSLADSSLWHKIVYCN
jgi:hypothetical protein